MSKYDCNIHSFGNNHILDIATRNHRNEERFSDISHEITVIRILVLEKKYLFYFFSKLDLFGIYFMNILKWIKMRVTKLSFWHNKHG